MPGDRERFAVNHAWFDAHLSELLPRYRGRFIAVDGGSVLAESGQIQELTRKFGKDSGVFIERVIRPEDEVLFVF